MCLWEDEEEIIRGGRRKTRSNDKKTKFKKFKKRVEEKWKENKEGDLIFLLHFLFKKTVV